MWPGFKFRLGDRNHRIAKGNATYREEIDRAREYRQDELKVKVKGEDRR